MLTLAKLVQAEANAAKLVLTLVRRSLIYLTFLAVAKTLSRLIAFLSLINPLYCKNHLSVIVLKKRSQRFELGL